MADTTISADNGQRISWRFVLRHPAHAVALGFGVGLVPGAPGTAGTLLAFPLYWALAPRVDPYGLLGVIAALFVIGIWICERTGRAMGRADHGSIVWDEIVAFLLVLFFTPPQLLWQAAAFLLFRLFDILKPPPIRYYDRTLKGGFGVMFDDLIAAFYTLIVLAITRTVMGS
ncbi:MAG TPA: phosphatidylglycerophosphatase A [Burkholderiales bacterium]|nr:phosphatidylglycerophosphatase A [Burkholderiales bacterium]